MSLHWKEYIAVEIIRCKIKSRLEMYFGQGEVGVWSYL